MRERNNAGWSKVNKKYIPNIVYLKETMITTAVTHVTIYSFPFFSFHINVNICLPS